MKIPSTAEISIGVIFWQRMYVSALGTGLHVLKSRCRVIQDESPIVRGLQAYEGIASHGSLKSA